MSASISTLRPTETATPRSQLGYWKTQVLWVVAIGLLGFVLTGLFSSLLELSRDWFVGVYLVVAIPIVVAYLRTTGVDVRDVVLRHWVWGVVGAGIMGIVMAVAVQRMDASPRDAGAGLA